MTKTIKLKELEHFYRDGSKIPDDRTKRMNWDDNDIVVLKKWKLEEILEKYSPPNPSWNDGCGEYDLTFGLGFEDVGTIDLRILFSDYLEKDLKHSTFEGETWTNIPLNLVYAAHAKGYRSLWQIKDKIEACLNKVDYKNRELVIYRSYGVANHGFSWDKIRIFSEKIVPVGV